MSRARTKVAAAADSTEPSLDHHSSLIHWKDVPHWMQDNAHIHSAYRKASYSYTRSFASVAQIHNETVNIWSHLVPGLLSLPVGAVLFSVLKPRYDKASTGDVICMSCFFVGAALCMGMSATYHTLSNHSPQVAKFWNQLDYAGIACLIAGSFIPSVYYGFWCEPAKQRLYWSMVSGPRRDTRLRCSHNGSIDLHTGGRMHRDLDHASLPHPCLAACEGRYVCGHGLICRLSCPGRLSHIRIGADAASNRSILAGSTRSVVHLWCQSLCG